MTITKAQARAKKTLKYMLHLQSSLKIFEIFFIAQATDVSLRQRSKNVALHFPRWGSLSKLFVLNLKLRLI
jgi:hypothetical protein